MSRPEPIPPNVDAGLRKAKEIGADVVVITDGDADRCGFADEKGEFIDQLRVYALLAMYLLDVRKQRGAIVKTLSTTSMLDLLGKLYNVPVYETGVGFKYVAPLMMKHDAIIGGEESGGYAFRAPRSSGVGFGPVQEVLNSEIGPDIQTFGGHVAAQTCVDPPEGLISWWPAEGNADDILGDNDGTLVNGATFAPGMVGQAFSFDGTEPV